MSCGILPIFIPLLGVGSKGTDPAVRRLLSNVVPVPRDIGPDDLGEVSTNFAP